ncbi:IS200/IS605 family transposase [Chloroflexota bacterium]
MSYWQLYYHITWATLERQPLLLATFEAKLHRFLVTKAKDMGLTVHAVNSMPDHVHLAVSIPPNIAVAECIGQLKGSSSHTINRSIPDISIKWQRGYGVVSFRQEQLPDIVAYIQRQKEHHTTKNVINSMEYESNDEHGPLAWPD